eukprot:472046_1
MSFLCAIILIILYVDCATSLKHPDLVKLFNNGAKKANDPTIIPQLSNAWIATTIDPPEGRGTEKYFFMENATDSYPSGHWFIYEGCQKLEYDGNDEINYYLKCFAVDCCYEDGDMKEWQIGAGKSGMNHTTYIGNKTVESFGEKFDCMGWETWYYLDPVTKRKVIYQYWLTFPTNNLADPMNTILHRIDWSDGLYGDEGDIQYQNFTPIPYDQRDAFMQEFTVPQVCQGNAVWECDTDY